MSDVPNTRQTLSFLICRFQQAGIRSRTDLGQNFMIDLNLQRVLLETAQIGHLTPVVTTHTSPLQER